MSHENVASHRLSFEPVALSCLAVSGCAFTASLAGTAVTHFPKGGMAVLGVFYLVVGIVYYFISTDYTRRTELIRVTDEELDSEQQQGDVAVHAPAESDLQMLSPDIASIQSRILPLNPVAKMCFAVTIGAFSAALGGVIVNQWISGWMNAAGMACVGVFYLVLGVANLNSKNGYPSNSESMFPTTDYQGKS